MSKDDMQIDPETVRQYNEFDNKVKELFDRDNRLVTTVINHHGLVDYYINNFLQTAYPSLPELTNIRLQFWQKLKLIRDPQMPYMRFYEAIVKLAELRNRFAHNIAYNPTEDDIQEIEKVGRAYRSRHLPELMPSTPGGFVALASNMFCMILHLLIDEIEKHGDGEGLVGYMRWRRANGYK